MAYQQQGAMGNGGSGEHHAPQGTEYTLQGVMRFLQIEWHNHERARNSWDIERAEMKAKIAKQEGECRHAKRINEQLNRQIRMLELALKNERAKFKAGHGQGQGTGTVESEGQTKMDVESAHRPGSNIPHNSFLDVNHVEELNDKTRDQYLDKTAKYLKGCMQEIQYLLTPPQHPPASQILSNGPFIGLPEPPLSMSIEDIYVRQQQRNQRQQGQMLAQSSSMPNHQHNALPQNLPQAPVPPSDLNNTGRYPFPDTAKSDEITEQTTLNMAPPFEDPAETVTHAFDAQGRAIPSEGEPQHDLHPTRETDSDGWTFDDDASARTEAAQPELSSTRRPDTDLFPSATVLGAAQMSAKSPPRGGPAAHRRKSSGAQAMSRRRSSQGKTDPHDSSDSTNASDPSQFKVKFALRGHLDVVRSVIFSGGGSPSEPEVCTAGDDGTIKRWIIPASYQSYGTASNSPDLDISAYFTHRGHDGIVTCLATCPASTGFSTGGRANGDGWIFSGGQDATVRVWERGRVDPKATLEGHTDAIWSVCVLPASVGVVFGPQSGSYGGPDRLLLVSGSADGSVRVWAVSPPPQSASPATGSRRGVGGSRRHSVTSGSNFPTSPQPTVASVTLFNHKLVHSIHRPASLKASASPTCICPLSPSGETFVVSYTDSSVIIFDTRTGEQIIGMASNETYDGTMNTSINAVVATSLGLEGAGTNVLDAARGLEAEEVGAGATGGREGVEGVVISGHEDRFVRFFDANSGQCTYTMLAHPSAISALALSKDGREAVSAGHDASIRFWSLEKRICTQDIVSHRAMRGEGVCDVAWSQDGRLVISAGGDGVVKVFAR